MKQRIGLYGGSFDPIHIGHLLIARSVAEARELDRVIFLPSATPPHKQDKKLTVSQHRAEMVQLAIEDEPRFELSDFDLTRSGPSYTVDTVAHFREVYGSDAAICWLIGADSLAELSTWHRVGDLVDSCEILTAHRPGWDQLDFNSLGDVLGAARLAKLRAGTVQTPRIEISATDIRRRAAAGLSIQYLVPATVRSYILANGLYRGEPCG